MRLRRLTAPLLAVLLLAGCRAPAWETPPPMLPEPFRTDGPAVSSPAPAPPTAAPAAVPAAPQVEVHWDALEDRDRVTPTARRLSEGWLDDFTPGRYGQVVPYIGGEQKVRYDYSNEDGSPHYETGYLYGLCTADGLVLTDAVYRSVYRLSWYDSTNDSSGTAPAWVVTRVLWDERNANDWDQGYYTAVGLVAADGSWYTGIRFRSGASSTIAVSPYSVLMMEDADNAVLISLADGSELARYSPYDFLGPEDPNGMAAWLFADGLQWGMLRCIDRYFYCDPLMSGGMMEGDPIWIDAATGQFLEEPPMEIPEYVWTGHMTFDGGWYEETPAGGTLVLHYYDGREESIQLKSELGQLSSVSRQHLIFYRSHSDGTCDYTLTNHALTVLYEAEDSSIWLQTDDVTEQIWPVASKVVDMNTWTSRYTVLDNDGRPLCASLAYPTISGSLTSTADGSAYRLIDLARGGKELFRLPRWAGLE